MIDFTPFSHFMREGSRKSFMKTLMLLFVATFSFHSVIGQGPGTAAPDPFCDQVDVISLFSNSYTDVPVDTWLTPWSQPPVTLTDLQIAGNDVKLYQDVTFLGIETTSNQIDASGMTHFNIDFWSNNATQFRVKLVDFGPNGIFQGGDDTEFEITFDNPVQNEWVSYQIPLSDFQGMNFANIAQYILSAMPNGVADFYIDNMYFSSPACPTAAPAPTCAANDVISMYSNSYTDVPVDTWLTPWSAAPVTLTDLQIAGNDTKLYQDVTFLGIETVSNQIDASTMTSFNIDFWSGNATQFRIKLVDFGPNGIFQGGDDTEFEITYDNPPLNQWVSYQIPLSAFQGMNFNNIAQLILSAMPNTVADFYIDNVYFSTCNNPVDITFCADLSCFPQAPQVPSVFGVFNGGNAGANPLTNQGGGIWCATVPLNPGDHVFKFFDQIEGRENLEGLPCTTTDPFFGAEAFRSVTVVAGTPQTVLFGWETCDETCVPPPPRPELPITFEDPIVDYNLGNFGGMDANLGVDPLDPNNTVVCATKTVGAACFAGTVIGNNGLESPIPFGPGTMNLVLTVDVYSPDVGTEFLLKVENSSNGGISSEVLAFTTVANQWETLVFDFANGNPAINLANTYDKIVVFAEFTCATDNAPGTGITYYYDNIQFCTAPDLAITCPPTASTTGCTAADVPPFADFAAFEAAGGSALDADPNSFMLINTTESGTCPVEVVHTYQITDICGVNTVTCDHITLVDAPSGPILTCPADQVVSCFEDIDADPNNLIVQTSCGLGFTAYVKQPLITGGIPGCDGTVYTYIYKAIDDCGRVGECSQQFIVQNDAPIVTVPAGTTVECFSDIEVDGSDATVVVACSDQSVEVDVLGPVLNGPMNCPGTTYTYTYQVKDNCGRIVLTERVFTNGQNAAPTIEAPVDMQVTCMAGVNLNPENAIVSTTCGDSNFQVEVTGPQIIGAMDCNGTRYLYTYTVTDECGRTASDIRTFTVNNEGPQFSGCEEDTWLQYNCEDYGGEAGTIAAIEAYIASVEAYSACGDQLTVFNNFNSNNINTCINNGINTITFRATDNCGRTTLCTTTYVVVDTEAPTIFEEAEDHWEICNYNSPQNFQDWVNNHGGAEAFDGCSSDNVFWSTIPSNPSFNCSGASGVTSTTVTFVVRDNCGNSTSTTATFNAFAGGFVSQGGTVENGDEEISTFELFQNQPNPFKDVTMIGFTLPESGAVSLMVYDVSGRMIHKVVGDYAQGYNQININRSELPASGILYYQVNTATDSDSKKMILLD